MNDTIVSRDQIEATITLIKEQYTELMKLKDKLFTNYNLLKNDYSNIKASLKAKTGTETLNSISQEIDKIEGRIADIYNCLGIYRKPMQINKQHQIVTKEDE